jgi:hypothetical protein
MSNYTNDDLEADGVADNSNKPVDGFADFSGNFPMRKYAGKQSTNLEARGVEENTLPYGGGDKDLGLELKDFPSAEYPYNQVRKTLAGHVTEFDDTPGRERILIKHRTGTGVEFQPDGTILMYSTKNTVRITAGDEKVIIEGDGDITYHGNLKLRVDGNFDLDVGGDINVTAGGDKVDDIKGGYRQDINGNVQSLINGNVSTQITKNEMHFVHGNVDNYIKGDNSTVVQGEMEQVSKGLLRQTSEEEAILSAPSINIGASSLFVGGDSGTIGGENMVYYGHTSHIPRMNSTSIHATAMYANTFTGDLTGMADTAIASDTAVYASYGGGPGGPAGYTNINDTTVATEKTTAQPDNVIMQSYLNESEFLTRKVSIDPGNSLYNQINRDADYGGVSDRTLSTTEVRSKLRDTSNQQNETFVGAVLAEGIISATFTNAIPDDIDRIESNEATVRRVNPKDVIGKNIGAETKRFRGSVANKTTVLNVAPKYKPENLGQISSRTELAQGVTIAKFLGGYGHSITFDHVTTNDERIAVARNLLLHAHAIRAIMIDNIEYDEHRLIVAEGIYRPYINETVTANGINALKKEGRAVVYELRDRNGNIDMKKTFDLASWWKDSLQFEKMILSYDTLNKDGSMIAQIVLITPTISSDYGVTYTNTIETRFNNFVQSTDELLECIQE